MECHECMLGRIDEVANAAAKRHLWTCLACGRTGCGSPISEAKDVDQNNSGPTNISHLETHASEWKHSVVMRWNESLDCRCLECNLQLEYPCVPGHAFVAGDESSNAASKRESLLQQAAALLHENRTRHSIVSMEQDVQIQTDPVAIVDKDYSRSPSNHTVVIELVRSFATRRAMKGLINLGNTCFFNSVMQNLVGVRMLREHFSKESIAQEGVLKSSLRSFFLDMDSNPVEKLAGFDGANRSIRTRSFGNDSVGSAVSPKILFSEMCKKAPRFRGFQQQDSHELFRCLLDGLHMEEESIRKSRSDMDKKAESDTHSKLKEEDCNHEKAPKKPDTLVEYMFGGQFSSTVTCRECGHSSVVYEPFLDLSLPIPSKQSFGKTAEPIGVPKLFAPRSNRDYPTCNGIPSLKAAQCSPFVSGPVDNVLTVIEDKRILEVPPPMVGFNLERNISVGEPLDSENSNRNYSRSEDKRNAKIVHKDHVGKLVGPPATLLLCATSTEAFVSCGKTNSNKSWIENVEKSIRETAVEGGGKVLIDDQRIGSDASEAASRATLVNQSRHVEVNSLEVPLTRYAEEFGGNSSRGIISTQGVEISRTDESLAVFQLEETVVSYDPHLPAESYGCAEDHCMALALIPSLEVEMQTAAGYSEKLLAGDESSINLGATLTSDDKFGSFIPIEEGEVDVVIGGLFDDIDYDSPSRNHTAPESQVLNSIDLGGLNSMDALVVPDDRTGSVTDLCEEDIYPTMSLEGCLQAFTKTEVLSEENAWACENCTRLEHSRLELDRLSFHGREHETNCLDKSPEAEECSGDIRPMSNTSNSGEGGWESVSLAHREGIVEDLIGSTNSISIIIVSSQETDESVQKVHQDTWGMVGVTFEDEFSQLDVRLNNAEVVNRRAGSSLTELSTVDSIEELHSFEAKEDGDEAHIIEGKSFANADERKENIASIIGRNAASSDVMAYKPDINGKATAHASQKAVAPSPKEEIGKKNLERDVTKMFSVKRDATKMLLISKAPLVLTVHLKRFAQDTYGRLSKLGGHITFYEELDLGPFLDHRDISKQDGVYQLIGTVEHSGTMRGGHYVAYVKGESEDSTEGVSTWYYISDSHVRKISLDDVLQSEAYLLFYERRSF